METNDLVRAEINDEWGQVEGHYYVIKEGIGPGNHHPRFYTKAPGDKIAKNWQHDKHRLTLILSHTK